MIQSESHPKEWVIQDYHGNGLIRHYTEFDRTWQAFPRNWMLHQDSEIEGKAIVNTFLFMQYPYGLIVKIVYNTLFWLRSFPLTDAIHPTLSLHMILVQSSCIGLFAYQSQESRINTTLWVTTVAVSDSANCPWRCRVVVHFIFLHICTKLWLWQSGIHPVTKAFGLRVLDIPLPCRCVNKPLRNFLECERIIYTAHSLLDCLDASLSFWNMVIHRLSASTSITLNPYFLVGWYVLIA